MFLLYLYRIYQGYRRLYLVSQYFSKARQHPPTEPLNFGAWLWSPRVEFSVQLPLVINTKSSLVSSIDSSLPSCLQTIFLASFLPFLISKTTFVTSWYHIGTERHELQGILPLVELMTHIDCTW